MFLQANPALAVAELSRTQIDFEDTNPHAVWQWNFHVDKKMGAVAESVLRFIPGSQRQSPTRGVDRTQP